MHVQWSQGIDFHVEQVLLSKLVLAVELISTLRFKSIEPNLKEIILKVGQLMFLIPAARKKNY